MSAKIMGMVFDAGPAEATQRFVLLAIADNCDDGGFAFPGVELLAEKSCQTVRNVLRILRALEVDGWLVVKRRSAGPRRQGNTYQLNLARLRKSAAKPVERPGDNLSPDDDYKAMDSDACDSPRDNLSPDARGDISGIHEVTNSTPPRDISGIPILINHQEPSREPNTPLLSPSLPKGTRFVSVCPEAVEKVMRECCLSNPRLRRVITRAITTEHARTDEKHDCNRTAEQMIEGFQRYSRDAHLLRFTVGARKFFDEGLWTGQRWPYDEQRLQQARRL